MRIKRLEVQGFKSFKDKTVIHFDHRITGIVGPNGCGKSNIVDAFFWVMGEQSYKHIRGNSSDDLIFNGSSKYSPLGLAEATLVMEQDLVDTENAPTGATAGDLPLPIKTKEISVTRRLYRSGEGEYFINGTHARLKDIHELFMDTGVGAKGYSVIEQGQIGKIVNAKPEDRRLLIEEAAGIAKYKARKKESLRKMEAATANLSRLNDVIQEIERNLGSLERQAQKARQYKKYKEELLEKEMTWGRRKAKVLNQRLESLKATHAALEQELIGLRAELQTAENTIEVGRISQVTEGKEADRLTAAIQSLSDELTRERSALELSRRRQGDLESQLTQLENERTELLGAIEIAAEKILIQGEEASAAEEAYQSAHSQSIELESIVRELRQASELSRRELEKNKQDLMSGITQASDLTSRAATLESRAENARMTAERLESQVQELAEKRELAATEFERASLTTQDLKATREKLQTERRERAAKVQELEQNFRSIEKEVEVARRHALQLRSKHQSLQELAAAREGIGEGPKTALDWLKKQAKDGQVSTLSDWLSIQSGSESAVEGWLEQKLESLILDSTQDPNGAHPAALALGALDSVRNKKHGRLAIHLTTPASANSQESSQNSIETIESHSAASKEALLAFGFEITGTLLSRLTFQPNTPKWISQLIEHATRGVWLVKSLSPIEKLLESPHATSVLKGWGIVAEDGKTFDPSGVIRGGSIDCDQSSSLLGRKRAIQELALELETAQRNLDAQEENHQQLKRTLEEARGAAASLQSDLQAIEVQIAGYDRDVEQARRTLKEVESQIARTEDELQRAQEASQSALEERESIREQVDRIIRSRSDLESQISQAEELAQAKEVEYRSFEEKFQALRLNEATLKERAQSLKRELEGIKSLANDRNRRLSDIERLLERASQERSSHTGGEDGLVERIQSLTLELGNQRELYSKIKDQMESQSASLQKFHERIKELHQLGDQKLHESNQIAIETSKLSADAEHLKQNLEEKYGIGCLENANGLPIQDEMENPVITQEMTAEEELLLGEEVERLRERIRRLGEVNVMAIEEFEEASKRFEYLVGEKRDLENSVKNLEEAIEHINKTSEIRFKKAFESIAERFERLFPIIFGGGQAQISLVYPEGSTDILEAGVDITAQPPGKKVVNIGLLSGGEKALTAVSLIFSIFMVKPSPFCILDEVDAPLDDANIGKFNALLREMSAKSQFILITHNKKTMELNDTLYGVTMEEPGVSKMVSIELR